MLYTEKPHMQRPCGQEVSPTWDPARGCEGLELRALVEGQCPVRSPQSQAWSPLVEASSLQWVPGATRGRDRQVSLMFHLLPPQVSHVAGWAAGPVIL